MFNVTEIHTKEGFVIVEDREMGLVLRFEMVNVMVAEVIGDYDLLMIDASGRREVVKILE
jgi:hypothetical protein